MGLIFLRNRVSGAAPADAYAIGGASPELVAAFLTAADGTTEGEYFRTAGVEDDFSMFTFSRSNNATMFDSTGTLVYAPHNLLPNTDISSTAWSKVNTSATGTVTGPDGVAGSAHVISEGTGTGLHYVRQDISRGAVPADISVFAQYVDAPFIGITFNYVVGSPTHFVAARFNVQTGEVTDFRTGSNFGVFVISASISGDLGDGWRKLTLHMTENASVANSVLVGICNSGTTTNGDYGLQTYTGTGRTVNLFGPHVHYANLGGMADNPDQTISGLEKYIPTTGSVAYLPRRNAYYHNGSSWVKGGLQLESAAATQLLHGTDSFATQDETVTAQLYTLQFRGTGSIVLSGTHSATLTGTGANDLVSLTFTPSAGTLTLTPSGTVDYPQLEVGRVPTSYIPNTAGSGTVTRAVETLTIAGADTPANTTALSISMKGLITYADTDAASQATFLRWFADGSNHILWYLYTNGGTGGPYVIQVAAGTSDLVLGGGSSITSGVNSPFSLAARHTSGAINAAINGTAATANTTPTALADLSSTTAQVGQTFGGFISELRIFGADIGDSGIEDVTT